MFLEIHVIVATFGILSSILNIIKPSKIFLQTTYFITFGTIISGVILTVLNHTVMARTCISGLIYLAFIFTSLKVAKYRLS